MFETKTPEPNFEALFHELGALLADAPQLEYDTRIGGMPTDAMKWLGRASALAHSVEGRTSDTMNLDTCANFLAKGLSVRGQAREIMLILHRILARIEPRVASASKGAFITAGEELEAFSALAKLLGEAKQDVLIVDPYMDASTLLDFAGLANEGVTVRLLTDEASYKPALDPAAHKWIAKHQKARPLSVRLAPARSLHDRLIFIDETTAYIITQSLKDIAKRAHASIQRVDEELTKMKLGVFSDMWDNSKLLVETA